MTTHHPSPTTALDADVAATGALSDITSLAEVYRRELFDRFLPFMDGFVIDRRRGGFLTDTTRYGERLSDRKRSWHEGRGIWVYSFLYQHITQDAKHLDIAHRSIELLLTMRPPADDPRWPASFAADATDRQPDAELYGSLFIIEGLAAFASATGDRTYWDLARSLLLDCAAFYERPDYPVDVAAYLGEGAGVLHGVRSQGISMILLRIATQLLTVRPDAEVESIATKHTHALTDSFYNSGFRLNNELLERSYAKPVDGYRQFAYVGHGIEALWMVMDEALRRGDDMLFAVAASRFRRHVDVAWDNVYGGAFRGLAHVDRNVWLLDKDLWLQQEILIGALMLVERLADPWAYLVFDRVHRYIYDHFVPSDLESMWVIGGNRVLSTTESRIEHYHHARHLMLNLLALERLSRAGSSPAPPSRCPSS